MEVLCRNNPGQVYWQAGRVLMDHDLDKVLEGWEGVRLQLGIPEVVRVELNDVELPLRNNVDLAHQRD